MSRVDGCILSDYAKGLVSPALARDLIEARHRGQAEPARGCPDRAARGEHRRAGAGGRPAATGDAARQRRAADARTGGHDALEPGKEAMHIAAEAREVHGFFSRIS
jgi:hypothetical protein